MAKCSGIAVEETPSNFSIAVPWVVQVGTGGYGKSDIVVSSGRLYGAMELTSSKDLNEILQRNHLRWHRCFVLQENRSWGSH